MTFRHLAVISVMAAVLIGGFCVSGPAAAQTPAQQALAACGPQDLACQVAALRQRVAELEGQQAQIETQAQTAIAEARAETVRVQGVSVSVHRRCANDCRAEATNVCTARGYASGEADDWTRESTGVYLTTATCRN